GDLVRFNAEMLDDNLLHALGDIAHRLILCHSINGIRGRPNPFYAYIPAVVANADAVHCRPNGSSERLGVSTESRQAFILAWLLTYPVGPGEGEGGGRREPCPQHSNL